MTPTSTSSRSCDDPAEAVAHVVERGAQLRAAEERALRDAAEAGTAAAEAGGRDGGAAVPRGGTDGRPDDVAAGPAGSPAAGE